MILKDRFLSKVKKTSTCWLWIGATVRGYGNIGKDGKTVYAHRLSYELFNGKIPDGMDICHSCDNKICVKPSHLWAGKAIDNMRDASRKGRMVRGERHPSAKLTEVKVRTIRKLSKSDFSQTKIASMFDISFQSVGSIIRGETWAWLN